MRALVFASHDLASLYDEAERLVWILRERKLEAALIDKLSTKTEDLVLVAKHGVVEPLVFVLLDESGVRARLATLPEPEKVLDLVRSLRTPNA